MAGKYLSETQKMQDREKKKNAKKTISFIWYWVIGMALLAVVLLNIFTHVFQVVNYSGSGMEPNLQGGQTLVIYKTQSVEPGDVIAFYYNNQVLVRRVICTGGDQVSIAADGTVSINEQVLEESYLPKKSIGQCNLTFPYHVPPNTIFVMGDNRETAMDSRLTQIGTVPEERIIGKVLF